MLLRPLPQLLLLLYRLGFFGQGLPGVWAADVPSAAKTLVWGPGLEADVVLPARFFYIQAVDSSGRKWVVSWRLGFAAAAAHLVLPENNLAGKECSHVPGTLMMPSRSHLRTEGLWNEFMKCVLEPWWSVTWPAQLFTLENVLYDKEWVVVIVAEPLLIATIFPPC